MSSSRNYGIDLLRIISMIGVVLLHVLGHGGILKSASAPDVFSLTWALEILAYPAVNCFILISGFVGYRGTKHYPRIKNLLSLYATAFFYSVLICLLFRFFQPQLVDSKTLLAAFTPVRSKQYWFLSCYVALFLLTPFLNLFVDRANGKHLFLFSLVLALFSLFSIKYDPFVLKQGYTPFWFALVYTVGAIMKKIDLPNRFSKKTWLILAASAYALSCFFKIGFHFINHTILNQYANMLLSYVSPTIVLMAIALFCIFAKLNIRTHLAPFINFFSTSAFSVYLMQDHSLVQKNLMPYLQKLTNGYGVAQLALFIVGVVLATFLIAVLIDKIRQLLFRLIKLDMLFEKADQLIQKLLNSWYQKLMRQ